jgi:hypothetical protein
MLTLLDDIPPQVLRQKRMYEGQRETLYNQQFNMEQTRFTVESIQDTVQTVQALKAANVQMKGAMKANKELDLSFIDNLQVGRQLVCLNEGRLCQLRADEGQQGGGPQLHRQPARGRWRARGGGGGGGVFGVFF